MQLRWIIGCVDASACAIPKAFGMAQSEETNRRIDKARCSEISRYPHRVEQEGLLASCKDLIYGLRSGQRVSSKAGAYFHTHIVDSGSLSGYGVLSLPKDDFCETPRADPHAGCCGEGRLITVPYPIGSIHIILHRVRENVHR